MRKIENHYFVIMSRAFNNFVRRFPSPQRETYQLRMFGLTKVPMIGFVWPSIQELNDKRAVIRIPLTWRTKNHVNSMYLGSLCVGADLSAGILGMYHANKAGKDIEVTPLFKSIGGDFYFRAMTDVDFICTTGEDIAVAVERCVKSGERINKNVKVDVRSPGSDKILAGFNLTLSLKANNHQ